MSSASHVCVCACSFFVPIILLKGWGLKCQHSARVLALKPNLGFACHLSFYDKWAAAHDWLVWLVSNCQCLCVVLAPFRCPHTFALGLFFLSFQTPSTPFFQPFFPSSTSSSSLPELLLLLLLLLASSSSCWSLNHPSRPW